MVFLLPSPSTKSFLYTYTRSVRVPSSVFQCPLHTHISSQFSPLSLFTHFPPLDFLTPSLSSLTSPSSNPRKSTQEKNLNDFLTMNFSLKHLKESWKFKTWCFSLVKNGIKFMPFLLLWIACYLRFFCTLVINSVNLWWQSNITGRTGKFMVLQIIHSEMLRNDCFSHRNG